MTVLWYCTECTTAYSPGAPRCPHCGSEKHSEDPVPKASKAGGDTNANDVQDAPEGTGQAAPDVQAEDRQDSAPAPAEDGSAPVTAVMGEQPQDVNATGSFVIKKPGAGNEE